MQRILCIQGLVGSALIALVSSHCANMCNGHGRCTDISKCACFNGWEGADCSLRSCPASTAWADVATGTDQAHNPAECSNRGICDHASGSCTCFEGYEGLACQRMKCPRNCNNHGVCRSIQKHAERRDPGSWRGAPYTYDDVWDAEMIYGCECDPGYEGYDCSLRICPHGDDPMTRTAQVNEVQVLKCVKDPTASAHPAGKQRFTLTFRGYTTMPIPFDAPVETLKQRLVELPSISGVRVTYSVPNSLCNVGAIGDGTSNVVSIEFTEEFGDLPWLTAHFEDGTVVDSDIQLQYKETGCFDGGGLTGRACGVTGTKEDEPCSRRGACDQQTGQCHCYKGFMTSDGYNFPGDRGDCGHAKDTITACPGIIECSGHGVCSGSPEYTCTCASGWTGGDCSEQLCPMGLAWFDYPVENGRAHQFAECSNKGICDRKTGECKCQALFTGEACEFMECPSTTSGVQCSGHGNCLSMMHLAEVAEQNGDATSFMYGSSVTNRLTWDYQKVFGCHCDEGWMGYDCSQKQCPLGDDPTTRFTTPENLVGQSGEVQSLTCEENPVDSTAKSFKLMFRQYLSDPIPKEASKETFREILERLPSIDSVHVSYTDSTVGAPACKSGGAETISITFVKPHGDVPLLTLHEASSGISVTDPIVDQDGTTENSECSERGVCDHSTGLCRCFPGWGSSNGEGGAGDFGDCGYREPYIPSTNENYWSSRSSTTTPTRFHQSW